MILTLPYPPTVNTYYRSIGRGRVIISKAGRVYQNRVIADVYEQTNGRPPNFAGRVRLHVVVHAPDRRVRDIGNLDKALCDSLKAARVYKDDGQIDDVRYQRGSGRSGTSGRGCASAETSTVRGWRPRRTGSPWPTWRT